MSRVLLAGRRPRLTRCVNFIREISHIVGTRPEDAPEGTAIHAVAELGQVNMAGHGARGPRDSKRVVVDVIGELPSDQNGQVVVAVNQRRGGQDLGHALVYGGQAAVMRHSEQRAEHEQRHEEP